jgi:hypothetical protein
VRQIFIASVLPAPDSPEIRIDCEQPSFTIVLNLRTRRECTGTHAAPR